MTSAMLIESDYNCIVALEPARAVFGRSVPEAGRMRDWFEQWFEKWYTGNFDQQTGKLTLYRFLNLSDFVLQGLKRGHDLAPSGVYSEEDGRAQVEALERQRRGEDISDFVARFVHKTHNITPNLAQFLTADVNNRSWKEHRITVKFGPNEAWRSAKLDGRGNWFGRFDRELEWLVLGSIPNHYIAEIYDQKQGNIVFQQ